jgi:biotin synthase
MIQKLYQQPFLELIYQAAQVQKDNFKSSDIEMCQLISVKTGGCPEDCAYCSQSNQSESEIKLNPLLPVSEVEAIAKSAKERGVKRICMGAAYKTPTSAAIWRSCEYIAAIKKHGLETCATLGSLTKAQALILKQAGLDYYNHNIDTSPEYYSQVITSRTFNDRLDTINHVGAAGIKVCCGGILGMGESQDDRISFIHALTVLPYAPSSIPINMLVKIAGTKLAEVADLDKFELLRTIATTRVLFPTTRIRLSAGRDQLSELEQALCFLAGANSIFYGDKLLTAPNNARHADLELLAKLSSNNA